MRWASGPACGENDPDVVMVGKRQQRLIAVVDDGAAVRRATQDLLNSDGFTARGYSSAEQLLRSSQRLLRLVEHALRARHSPNATDPKGSIRLYQGGLVASSVCLEGRRPLRHAC
jgi:hypothetical protein